VDAVIVSASQIKTLSVNYIPKDWSVTGNAPDRSEGGGQGVVMGQPSCALSYPEAQVLGMARFMNWSKSGTVKAVPFPSC